MTFHCADCVVKSDTSQWHTVAATDTDTCKAACLADSTDWQWVAFIDSTCYCLSILGNGRVEASKREAKTKRLLTAGILDEGQCNDPANPIDTFTAHRIWKLSCPVLPAEHNNMVLTVRDAYFLDGSYAIYHCKAGHKADGKTGMSDLSKLKY